MAALEDNSVAWIHDDSELSLAGLQNKLLLVGDGSGGWARPAGGQPSTHVLKLDDLARPGLVAAEYHALRLAEQIGISNLSPELAHVGERQCIIVRRYDRTIDASGTPLRHHQEDLCQALGFDQDANRGRGKYEAHGGPTLRDAAELLARFASVAAAELAALLRLTVLNVAVGNADAHGKNLSVLLAKDGHITLAPAYDVVPTVLWPKLRVRPAMTVNGRSDLTTITGADLIAEATRWGIPSTQSRSIISDTLQRIAAETIEHDGLARYVATSVPRLSAP